MYEPDLNRSQCAALQHAVDSIVGFYRTMWYYLVTGGSFVDCPYFRDNRSIRCQLYSLTLIMHLWEKDHYRNGTFRDDMIKNLRNVAVPGTGVPLSLLCYFRLVCLLAILFLYPLVAFVAAINAGRGDIELICSSFCEQLLCPKDWFSFWRMNCRLASLHALVTKESGYKFEDKWSFLTVGEERGVPVSPWLKTKGLFVKHRNEEGGLGCASYKNAIAGGDWIIQECLENADSIKHLLPENAPLSTLRVISGSRGGLRGKAARAHDESLGTKEIECLSCVFRAGRAGALTDHESILFDVDTGTGIIKKGTTNAHWYQLGPQAVTSCPWTSMHNVTHHPDSGAPVTGQSLPDMPGILALVENAHAKLAPGVPLIGWDVALTTKGVFLLEGNFSCNFFRGTFDHDSYFRFVEDYLLDLEEQQMQQKQQK